MHHVAFLRGMNLGGRRLTNEELCEAFRDLGFEEVTAVLTSGNVIFRSESAPTEELIERLQTGLREALGYEVPVFLRTAEEVATIAAARPFEEERGAAGGKLQVSLLADRPTTEQRR
ncbi:MAG: DUF1697 domain-containing protein, partial [Planctomycetota bacterium]